jgi:hypothetical protein
MRVGDVPHIFFKNFNNGYIFFSKLASIKGLHKKLWASKVTRTPILGIARLLTWSPGKNAI